MSFKLHNQLKNDLIFLKDLTLSKLFILPDDEIPWLVLVPSREDITEIYQLSSNDQAQLIKEVSSTSQDLSQVFDSDKINIGALGNMVPQLHIHIICRSKSDRAWPEAIWGTKAKENHQRRDEIIRKLKNFFIDLP